MVSYFKFIQECFKEDEENLLLEEDKDCDQMHSIVKKQYKPKRKSVVVRDVNMYKSIINEFDDGITSVDIV